jgi:hypothetical protein
LSSHFRDAFDIGGTITRGYQALRAAPWPILLGALIMQCTEGGGPGGGGGGGGGGNSGDGYGGDHDWQGSGSWFGDRLQLPPLDHLAGSIGATEAVLIAIIVLVLVGFMLVCGLALFALRTWLEVGYLRVQREALETGTGSFQTLFGGADRFWSMAGFKLLGGVIALGTMLLSLLPGGVVLGAGLFLDLLPVTLTGGVLAALMVLVVILYVGLGLALGKHALVFEGLRATEAIERTWELTRGHRLWLLVYLFVIGILRAAGLCLCCVGVFLTRALTDTATTAAYLALTRGPSREEGALASKP